MLQHRTSANIAGLHFPMAALGTPRPPSAYEGAMERMRFAVLDVETTSGDPKEGRVMEVAIVALDGTRERMRWDSLVDPRTKIPSFIRRKVSATRSIPQALICSKAVNAPGKRVGTLASPTSKRRAPGRYSSP